MSLERHALNKPVPKQKPTLPERNQQVDLALATRYDALNQLFTEAEQIVKALRPLHSVWVDYGHDHCNGQPDCWDLLGITKHQGKWRLCHAIDNDLNEYGPLEVKPIVECVVEVRVQAAKIVRQLREKIVKSKEQYVPKVDEAIKELMGLSNEQGKEIPHE